MVGLSSQSRPQSKVGLHPDLKDLVRALARAAAHADWTASQVERDPSDDD